MLLVAGACIFLALAIWIPNHAFTIIDPYPSFEIEKVDLPSPNKDDPLLVDVEHVLQGFEAPEDGFLFDDKNDWIWSMGNGDLLRVNLRTMTSVPFAHTGETHINCGSLQMESRCGRPLGLLKLPTEDHVRYQKFFDNVTDNETPLCLVADAYKGLLLVSSKGTIVPLLTNVVGKPLLFANAMTRARSGIIYLSDSSKRWLRNQVLLEQLESRPTGRVISWNPDTEKSTVVAENLPFPNGIVLRDNDQSLLVSLTTRHQIVRINLTINDGDGQKPELFAALPGIPDNLHVSYSDEWKRSVLWVGTATKSSAVTHWLNRLPKLRKLLAMMFSPHFLMKCFKRYGLLLALDADTGKLLHAYQDPTGATSYIAGIHFDDTYAYIGSWLNHFLARIPREKLFSVDLNNNI